ncbi:hypothetical protein QBC38DRAFT_493791 [Podospora fimiseda]|uniref:DUF2293 domain-containing protein n=1 Tax=Podospora fimiseda TaxID=252190 RepID=A0AAN6YKA5_9PEZI|nr:hypothetical protein QBC38DRAFT_493791 [Podospora fimiseda]
MEREVHPSAPMPEGYRFVRRGDVYITKHCKKQTREVNKPLYVVVDHGKNLGLRCPAFVHKKVLLQHQATATERAAAVKKRDTATEDKFQEILVKLFPKIPQEVVAVIVNHALKKHSGRVGRTETIPIEDKVWFSVHAHIRHVKTDYDQLLKRGVSRKDARNQTWPKINEVAKQWGRQHNLLPSKANNGTAKQPDSSRPIPLRTKKSAAATAALVRPLYHTKTNKATAPKPTVPAKHLSAKISKKHTLKTSKQAVRAMRATPISPVRTRSMTRSQVGKSSRPASEPSVSTEMIVISSDDEDDNPSDGEDSDYDTDDFIVDDEDEEALIVHSDTEDSCSSPLTRQK